MKIIATTDTSTYGNDCYINKSVTLAEQFGVYAVIIFDKTTGWYERNEVDVMTKTTDYDVAVAMYKYYGGVMPNEAVGG